MDRRKGFLGALILGLVTVPGLALATGMLLSSPASPTEAAAVSSPEISARNRQLALEPATVQSSENDEEMDLDADLQQACGPAGLDLVALEEAKTISPLEQSALDALREICAEHGLPLPEEAPAQVIQEVIVVEAGSSPPSSDVSEDDDSGGAFEDRHEDEEGEGDEEGEEEEEGEEGEEGEEDD